MSRALKALAWIAPRAALSRARAFDALDNLRAYDGAKMGRRQNSFSAGATSANVEIGPALSKLRDRSREMARNTWVGARILDVMVGHAVGTGINAVANTGSDRQDRQLGDAWTEWCETSDVEGVNPFGAQQAIAARGMFEGGDVAFRRVPLPGRDRRAVKLGLQLLEGDFIDHARDQGVFEGQNSRLGVGLGDWGARTGYWLHTQHPGDFSFQGGAPFLSQFVDRNDVAHLYRPLRAGQVRGVPIFAPILMTARDLTDLVDAVIVKARTEACFSAFVTLKEGGAQTPIVGPGKGNDPRVEEMRPGMVAYLGEGETVNFAQPTGSGQFESVWLSNLFAMAAGAGITYDQLTGDLRQANYSSLRAGKIEHRRLIEQLQWHVLVPQMMAPATRWFTDSAMLAGVLPGTHRGKPLGWRFDYVMPAVEPIDPRKDLEADILAVRAGRLTPQEFISAWGQDWRKVVEDTASFMKMLDDKGLVLDIDPRRTSQIGVAQFYATDPPGPTPANAP